jgi:multiple sugar transport system substrate-binding protein
MKTICALLAAATLFVGFVPAGAETKLTIQYPYPSLSRPVHEELARQFKSIRPDVSIEYLRPAENHNEALQHVLREALAGTMPDISFQGLHLARTLVERKLAVPLDDCLAQSAKELGYAGWALEMGRVNGKIYGLPYGLTAPVLFVNEDLLKQAGVNVETPPDSWEELLAIGSKVKALDRNIVGMEYLWNLTGDFMFQTLLFSRGGSLLSADESKIAFNDAAGNGALKTIEMFGKSDMPYMTFPQANAAFAAGTLGIMANTTAFVSGLERQIDGRFTMRLWPFPRDKAGRLPAGGNIPIVLTRDEARQKAACDYVRFIAGPVGQTIMVERIGYLTGSTLALNDEKYLKGYVEKNKLYAWTLQQLPHLTSWYAFPGDNALKIMDVINKQMEAVFTRKKTAEEGMSSMAGEVQALIRK